MSKNENFFPPLPDAKRMLAFVEEVNRRVEAI